MFYDDIEDFYNDTDNKLQQSMYNLASEIVDGLENLIKEKIYGSYSPKVYERTYELYDAIKVEVVKKGICNYELSIKISNERHPDNPTWIGEEDTFEKILEKFADNGFYRRNGGIDVMQLTYLEWIEMGKALNIIKDYLSKWFNFE